LNRLAWSRACWRMRIFWLELSGTSKVGVLVPKGSQSDPMWRTMLPWLVYFWILFSGVLETRRLAVIWIWLKNTRFHGRILGPWILISVLRLLLLQRA
jgi:hypothetical protein